MKNWSISNVLFIICSRTITRWCVNMYSQIGLVIKARRKALGYSQEDLADVVNRTPSHIGQIERGDSLPSVDVLIKIVEVLSIDGRQLFSTSENINEMTDITCMLSKLEPQIRTFIIDIIRMAYKNQMKRK